jgi:hypothetical protein
MTAALALAGASMTGCGYDDAGHGHSTDDTLAPDPSPQGCDGRCVDEPPATYTGPSHFWLGPIQLAEPCPDDVPEPGVQGPLENAAVMTWARECLVTPAPTCEEQGKTCVPQPSLGFRVCIHHDGDEPCRGEYTARATMVDLLRNELITLCCVPGHGD